MFNWTEQPACYNEIMIKRSLVYMLIGLVFGTLDWFYLDWLANGVTWGSLGDSIIVVPIIILMNFGIWLVPIIPVVIYEARQSHKIRNPMWAGVLTWCCAIFAYYAYYSLLLVMGKLEHLEHLNVFSERSETFWFEFWQIFKQIILIQFLEWIIIAIIGGAFIGALAFWVFHVKSSSTGEGT